MQNYFSTAAEFTSLLSVNLKRLFFFKQLQKYLAYTTLESASQLPSLQVFSKDTPLNNIYYNNDELDDTWDVEYSLRQLVPSGPARLVKHLLTQEYLKENTDLLKFNFFDSNNQTGVKVPENDSF